MSYGAMDISSGGGKYLKVESGKPVTIHVLTKSENIHTKKVYYDGKKYIEILKGDILPEGMKEETRYSIQVFDRADQTVKVFEFGPNIAIGIRETARVLEMDGQTIHDVDLHISRVSDKPIRYQVVQRKNAGPIPLEIDEEVPF